MAEVVKPQQAQEAEDDTAEGLKRQKIVGTGNQYEFRKRPKDNEDDLNAVEDPKRIFVAPIQKGKRAADSPASKKTTEMDNHLSVVKATAMRSRRKTLEEGGRTDDGEWSSPVRLPVPVKNPSRVQQNIWEVIYKRARAVKERRRFNVSKKASGVLNLPAQRLVDEIEAIAKGLSKAKSIDDTVLVYTQCLLDVCKSSIVSQESRTDEMSSLRRMIAEWHHLYRHRVVTLVPGSINHGGAQIDHYEMTSLLIGDGYSGWLNGDIIHAALTLTVDRQQHYIIPAQAWEAWHERNHRFYIPHHSPCLVAMVHWGNHWAVVIADRISGYIHYLDSMEESGRRQMAVASMRNLVNLHPQYNGLNWRESPTRSPRQTNTYDCGVWAVVNTWSWMERGNSVPAVGLADRLRIGRVLVDAAIRVDQTPMAVTPDEVEYMGRRTVTPNTTPAPARSKHSSTSSLSTTRDPFSPDTTRMTEQTLNIGREATPTRVTPQRRR